MFLHSNIRYFLIRHFNNGQFNSVKCLGLVKDSLMIQMKLLEKGFNTEAIEISMLISQYESFENIPEEELDVFKRYEVLADQATGI